MLLLSSLYVPTNDVPRLLLARSLIAGPPPLLAEAHNQRLEADMLLHHAHVSPSLTALTSQPAWPRLETQHGHKV
jgi:hypothetical protein